MQEGLPVTPDVSSVCPSTKPEMVAVSAGFATPNGRLFGSAVTISVGRVAGGDVVPAGPTVKLCWTWGDGAQVPSPAWSAAIVQVPAARSVRAPVAAPTVQTDGVVEL